MSDFDLTASRRYRARLAKQRAYQAKYRAGKKTRKAPDREDVAKANLTASLDSFRRLPARIDPWMAYIVSQLEMDGFDRKASNTVVLGIVDRALQDAQEETMVGSTAT